MLLLADLGKPVVCVFEFLVIYCVIAFFCIYIPHSFKCNKMGRVSEDKSIAVVRYFILA
jgi:hypothetical protein